MKVLKFISNLIVLICFSVVVNAQTDTPKKAKTDLEKNNLKGNVKTVLECTYSAKDSAGIIVKGDINSKKITKFDKNGNIIEFY